MKNAFIFHGTGGYPEENWFPWMKDELKSLGFNLHVPQFPTPENQTLKAWFDVFKEYEKFVDEHTLMIGHSLGGAFLFRVLEGLKMQIAAACIVSAPVGILPIRNWISDQPFMAHPFDWQKIREHARKFVVFHSDDDPYVCLENGEEIAKQLGVLLSFIPNAGHFNTAAGYTKFPELLNQIKQLRL